MTYAVNVADWTACRDDFGLRILLGNVVDADRPMLVDAEPGRVDAPAVVLDCEEERAEAIVDVIREKYERHELRCYKSTTGRSWRRI